jgi:EmrB/QacA subfamily drug resistance transporter
MSEAVASEAIPHFSHQQIRRVVVGIMLCILLAALDQTVVVPAVPAIAADLNGFNHLAWIVSVYLLTSTAATPLIGKLSDTYGRRALLLPSLVLFILTSALCALAQSLVQLILFRALQGVGGAGLMAMSQAAVADVVAPRDRGRYQGYMASMWGLASVAGPVVGGYLVDNLSWRWIFWINVPIGLAAFLVSNRALRLLKVRRLSNRIDYAGAALLTGCITTMLLVLSLGGTSYPWGSPIVVGLLAASLAMLALLVVVERSLADPLLPPRMFTTSAFVGGVIIAFFSTFAMFGGTFLLPLYFQLARGADASASGFLVMPFLAAMVFGAVLGGQLARRLGRTKWIIIPGLLSSAIGFAGLALPGADGSVLWATLCMILLGTGVGTLMPTIMVTVQNAAERRDVGIATGTLLLLRSMGGAFGSTIVGAVLAARFGANLLARGVTVPVDMASLRGSGSAIPGLAPDMAEAVHAALQSAFRFDFLLCAVLMLVAMAVGFGLRDVQLRGGQVGGGASHSEGGIGH